MDHEGKTKKKHSIYITIILWIIAGIQIIMSLKNGFTLFTYASVVALLFRFLGSKICVNISNKIDANVNLSYIIGFVAPICGTIIYLIFAKLKDKKFKIWSNFTNFSKTGLIILLIIISMYSAIHFRTYTYDLPATQNWAESTVMNQYKSQIANQVNTEFPNLPEANKQKIIEERSAELYAQEKENIDSFQKSLEETYKKDFQDENNRTYLLAIDPYYYYGRSTQLIEEGTVCDEIIEGECFDMRMKAPLGTKTKLNGADVVEVTFIKIARIFNPNYPIKDAIYIIPAIIIMLGTIPIFFLVKKYAGILGGFFSAMMVALHPYLLGRTPAGFVDTDAYGITCALFIIWFLIEAFSAKKYQTKGIFAVLAGISTWIFYQTWGGGWYFTFDILLAILIGMILYQIVKIFVDYKTHHLKRIVKSRVIKSNFLIVFAYLIIVFLFLGSTVVIKGITAPVRASKFQDAANAGEWPNVFTTVAELNAQNLSNITSSLVSNSLFQILMVLVILSIPLSLIKKYDKNSWYYLIGSLIVATTISSKKMISKISPMAFIGILVLILFVGIGLNLLKERKYRASILLPAIITAFYCGTIFASLRGIRFVLLGINTYSIMLGLTIGILFLRLSRGLKRTIDIPQIITKSLVIIVTIFLLISYAQASHRVGLNEIPQMNDAWFESLNKINNEAADNAIISSWWDFGHWFKAIAKRPVTFDGASQNTPMAHWIGKSLATNNEDLTIGILRMLDCGSNTAFETLNSEVDDTYTSVNLLNQIIVVDKNKAKIILEENGISSEVAEDTVTITHCENPPEAYYITSEDMVGKAGVWSHFGLWDFMKADLYNNARKLNFAKFQEHASKYDLEETEISEVYDQIKLLQTEREANTWISGWPGFSKEVACFQEPNLVKCNVGTQIGIQDNVNLVLEQYLFNTTTEEGYGIVGAYRGNSRVGETNMSLAKFVSDFSGELKTYESSEGINLGIMNIGNQGVSASKEIVDSTFAKLFYFDGAYTEKFEKFSDVTSVTNGQRIIIWKVNWESEEPTNTEIFE